VDDAELIRRSCEDPEWFALLFERHGRQIPSLCRLPARHPCGRRRRGRHVPDRLPAPEVYDQRYRLALPWLYGIATTLIARHRRGEQRFLRAIERTGIEPPAESLTEQVVAGVAAQGQERHLAAALAALSRKDRDVLLLVALGDLTYEEVAQTLAIPIGTVRSRLHRVRRKVREALGGKDPITSLPEE
jgi:RNA polymerase sigma factor (sigma-70 family)